MKAPEGTLCFTCGLPIADPPRFNHLPSGRPCPSCKDRLLESLPALLPGEGTAQPEAAEGRGPDDAASAARSLEVLPGRRE